MAAVATTGGSSREARRRRIVERGADRLALITGRIQSLPPDPDQSHSSTSTPVLTTADSAQLEDVAPNSSLPTQDTNWEPRERRVFDETLEPLLHNSDKGEEIITSRAEASHDTKEGISCISSSMQSPALSHRNEPRLQSHRSSLTPGQIHAAIAGSENIRMCCSVTAAILVILSYIGFPILGLRIIRGVIMFRPVYLLLLTDISIVIGRALLGTQGAESRTGRRSSSRLVGGNSSVDQLGKALELALLLQNIARAWFMDFSIYTVVLVSGLSLMRGFRW